MISSLPQIKGNAVYGTSTLSEFFNNSTQSKSTGAQTSTNSTKRQVFQTPSKSLLLNKNAEQRYFYKPDDNILKPRQQKKSNPLEPMGFHMDQPDTRIRKKLFQSNLGVLEDSVVSTGAAGKVQPDESPNFYLTNVHPENPKIVPTVEINYKMYQGKKLVNDETNRVETHETIRKKQLEIEEENRVRQIIKEKQEMAREKGYTIRLKEESTERNANFAKINYVREDHF